MTRNLLTLSIFLVLGYGFWISPDFKTITAGVAIFLLGMLSLEKGFKAFSGGVLSRFLQRTTDTTAKSMSFGLISTSLMQSSSLVSVLAISFLSAGLISLAQGIGIIFGANLGTTTGAWLVAGLGLKIDIGAYALPMLVFGVIMIFQKNSKRLSAAGWALIGLGFLFLGIAYMKEGFEAVSNGLDLSRYAVPGLRGLLIYIVIGIAMTVIMQSSHATLILTLTALAAGQVSYENALALAIGSNIGTTITALLAAISASTSGRQLALAHLFFNLTTGALAVVFIGEFSAAVDGFSKLVGIAADDYPLKFAAFHTLFNLVGVIVMVPLINPMVVLLQKLLRERVEPVETTRVQFLNKAALEFPDTALDVIAKETLHLAGNAFEILAHGLNLHRTDITSNADINAVIAACSDVLDIDINKKYRRKVKPLYSAIMEYATRAEQAMDPEQLERLYHLRRASWHIVNAIKAMNELQININRYMCDENEYVRREYNSIRLSLALLLNALFNVDSEEDLRRFPDQLKRFREAMEQEDITANGTLDQLIRNNQVTPDMATSLMNDSGFAHDIQDNLLHAAQTLYANLYSTNIDMALTDAETDSAHAERREALQAEKDGNL